jgi:hypothetical protein
MNIFKKLFIFPTHDDILEYSIYHEYNRYLGMRYILLYTTKYCIFAKTVKRWSDTFLEKYNLTFDTQDNATKFAKEHPTYGSIVEWVKNSRINAYKSYNDRKEWLKPKRII